MRDWCLKTFVANDLDNKNIWCLTQKLNHVFKDNKYYCLFFIYMKQLSPFNYVAVVTKLHIKSWTSLFRWGIYWGLDHQICTLSSESQKKERFLKEKRKSKSFIFMTMLSFNQIKSNYSKKGPCERGCSWIIKFSHCLNFGYYKYGIIIFSIRTQNGCACSTNKEKTLWSKQLLLLF